MFYFFFNKRTIQEFHFTYIDLCWYISPGFSCFTAQNCQLQDSLSRTKSQCETNANVGKHNVSVCLPTPSSEFKVLPFSWAGPLGLAAITSEWSTVSGSTWHSDQRSVWSGAWWGQWNSWFRPPRWLRQAAPGDHATACDVALPWVPSDPCTV